MLRIALVVVVALSVFLCSSPTASAAWTKPGKCRVPAAQRDNWDDLDPPNNKFSTKRVPCFIAAFTIVDMLREDSWSRDRFRHTSYGARWIVRLNCRGRVDPGSDAPQPGRIITCRVRSGEDAESRRDRVRNLRGGSLRWTTAYTG